MQLTTTRKVVVAVGATIVLGAVGSGVWELVFSPSVSWLGRNLLTLVTLGLDSVSDAIYTDVAKGHHEQPSLAVYTFVATVVLFLPIVLALRSLLNPRIRRSLRDKEPEQLAALQKRVGSMLIWLLLTMTFLGTAIYVRALMHSYTNAAITYFNQSLTIVLPYISPEEERRLRSEFARISSKRDYEQVAND